MKNSYPVCSSTNKKKLVPSPSYISRCQVNYKSAVQNQSILGLVILIRNSRLAAIRADSPVYPPKHLRRIQKRRFDHILTFVINVFTSRDIFYSPTDSLPPSDGTSLGSKMTNGLQNSLWSGVVFFYFGFCTERTIC